MHVRYFCLLMIYVTVWDDKLIIWPFFLNRVKYNMCSSSRSFHNLWRFLKIFLKRLSMEDCYVTIYNWKKVIFSCKMGVRWGRWRFGGSVDNFMNHKEYANTSSLFLYRKCKGNLKVIISTLCNYCSDNLDFVIMF